MPNYSKGDVVLVRYPFTDLSSAKIRPAVVFQAAHTSTDILIVPPASQTTHRVVLEAKAASRISL